MSNRSITFFTVIKFTAGYWYKQPGRLAFIMFLIISAAIMETYFPVALSSFLGAIREHQPRALVLYYLEIFLGIYLVQALLRSISFLIYNCFETKIFKSIQDDAFTHVQRLPEQFFVNTFTGSIISKINRARYQIEVFEDQILLRIIPTIVILLGSLLFLAQRFPILAILLAIYLAIFITVTSILVFKVSGPAQSIYADAQDTHSAHLADSVTGVATTKAYAQEQHELAQYYKVTEDLRAKNLKAYLRGNTNALIQNLLLAGMLVLLMGGGTWYYFQQNATLESMAYLAFAYTIMQSYIREVGENIKNILTSSYELHAVIKLMRECPEEYEEKPRKELQIKRGEIVFEQVSFTYPSKSTPIFSNLSVKINAGERVALVGHSGGGKTTFIRLLQSLYLVQNGRIIIDGHDIAHLSHHSLRKNIALVPQDPILFHRTLKENIAYGKPTATMDEIKVAAQKAHIDEFIQELPEQYDTLVGERGIKLSGGERQRIAIARALLSDRPILILDEATSSLDSESEQAIQEALHTLITGRTALIIAHRLSTILDVDRILVFDAGRVIEDGSHVELLKMNGVYTNLYKLQSGGFMPNN